MPIADSFERWHIDILELTQTKEGYRYVLLVVDSFSRWSEAFALKSQDAASIAITLLVKLKEIKIFVMHTTHIRVF
jgi:hypothetical protein